MKGKSLILMYSEAALLCPLCTPPEECYFFHLFGVLCGRVLTQARSVLYAYTHMRTSGKEILKLSGFF